MYISMLDKIIICIISCDKNKNKQKYIRNTWIKNLIKYNIKYYFIMGTKSPKILKDNAYAIIDDILYLNCLDDYASLSSKVGSCINYIFYNTNFIWMYKIDDDCYLNVNKLINLKFNEIDFYGKFVKSSKYKLWRLNERPYYLLLDNKIDFNFYAGGSGYIINRYAMEIISKNLDFFKKHYLEDIGISKILSKEENIYITPNDYITDYYNNLHNLNLNSNVITEVFDEEAMNNIHFLLD